jgi:hypothetical protein
MEDDQPDDGWLGRTLCSLSTWLIVGLGIYLHCQLNYLRWQNAGVGEGLATVDQVAPISQVFIESAIGSAIAVALVVMLSLMRGEKFEWTSPNEDFGGKTRFAGKMVAAAIVIGFVFMVSIEIIDPINKSRTESMLAARRMERVERMQRERQVAAMAQDRVQRQGTTRVDGWQRSGPRAAEAFSGTINTARSYRSSRPAQPRGMTAYETQMAQIQRQLSTGNNLR